MDISQLKYFCAVAEENNITRASKELHITQSALSTSIQRLEQELGTVLFDRVGRKIVLNGQGSIFYQHAQAMIREYDAACQAVKMPSEKYQSVLTVGCTETNFPEKLTTGFKVQNPGIVLRQILLTGELTDLEIKKCDFVLSCFPVKSPEIFCQRIWEENMFLGLRPDHPLAGRFYLHLEMLCHESFVTLPEGYEGRKQLKKLCEAAGFEPEIGMECLQHHIPAMVEKGFGIGVFPENAVRSGMLPDSLKLIPIVDDFSHRSIFLLGEKQKLTSAAAGTFMTYLKSNADFQIGEEQCWKNGRDTDE